MIIKRNDNGTWFSFESAREINLFIIATTYICDIPNEIINAKIQKVANKHGIDETDVILQGIDAASVKEFAIDMVQKILHTKIDEITEQ